jgi:hypothetical protein
LEEIAPLVEIVLAGYSSEYDRQSNLCGSLDEDAEEAEEAIGRLCDRARDDHDDHVRAWEAGDWFGGIGSWRVQCKTFGVTAETSDAELAKIAKIANDPTDGDDCDEIRGVTEHFLWLRKKAREAAQNADEAMSDAE